MIVKKGLEVLVAGALYAAPWALGGMCVGAFADDLANGDINEVIEDNAMQVREIEAAVVEHDGSLNELTVQLGEACVATLRPYTHGQTLSGVEPGEVVNDLMTNPDLPCGDNPTIIRENLQKYRTSISDLEEIQIRLDRSVEKTSELEETKQEDDIYSFARFLMACGVVVGGIQGLTAPIREYSWWTRAKEELNRGKK